MMNTKFTIYCLIAMGLLVFGLGRLTAPSDVSFTSSAYADPVDPNDPDSYDPDNPDSWTLKQKCDRVGALLYEMQLTESIADITTVTVGGVEITMSVPMRSQVRAGIRLRFQQARTEAVQLLAKTRIDLQ